jgi:hypothetical protein
MRESVAAMLSEEVAVHTPTAGRAVKILIFASFNLFSLCMKSKAFQRLA